jgi:hypothetical protein
MKRPVSTPVKAGFKTFRSVMSLQNKQRIGQSASAQTVTSMKYPEHFKNITEENVYTTQQVFGLNETGPFW